MRADDRALADLAASVADGSPVDWQAAEASAPDQNAGSSVTCVSSTASRRCIAAFPLTDIDAASPGNARPDGRRWGRLVLLEHIGHGTSCDVYRAWDSELHRDVALKLLQPRRADADARATTRCSKKPAVLARVRHPQRRPVYGAEQHDGRVGLWMELVRGESLDEIVADARPASARAKRRSIGQRLCAARSPPSTPPACCTATSRRRTSCATPAAASC